MPRRFFCFFIAFLHFHKFRRLLAAMLLPQHNTDIYAMLLIRRYCRSPRFMLFSACLRMLDSYCELIFSARRRQRRFRAA